MEMGLPLLGVGFVGALSSLGVFFLACAEPQIRVVPVRRGQVMLRETLAILSPSSSSSASWPGSKKESKTTSQMAPIAVTNVSATASSASASFSKQTDDVNVHTGPVAYVAVNSTGRKLAFVSFIAFESLVVALPVAVAMTISPVIVPVSIALTVSVMGGASLFAYMRPAGSLEHWQGPLMGGLMGIIGMGLVGIGAQMIMGPNSISHLLFTIEPYVGIALFTGLTAFDTQRAILEYRKGRADPLENALSLYLNAINLFIRIMELMGRFYKNK